MKYLISAFKYIKSNFLTWIAYAVAVLCFAAIVDTGAIKNVIDSFSDGLSSAGITTWFYLFLPVNTSSWLMIVLSLVAYVILALDLSFICSSTDKHMRYNSLSGRGLFSSFNNNILPCAIAVILLLAIGCVMSILLAAVMKAVCYTSVAYLFILGMIICVIFALAIFYVLTFFSLWLPCFIITGFRAYESLSYSYSLEANIRKQLFLAVFIPTIIVSVCSVICAVFAPAAVAIVVISLLCGVLFVYIPVLCFSMYIDADGITREDLKKF